MADFVRDNKFDLFAKSDFRFIESVYKLLVDQFSYKPAISVHQFFSEGFAEHKIILCKDIARLMHQKHQELTKNSQIKSVPKSSVKQSAASNEETLPSASFGQKARVVRHDQNATSTVEPSNASLPMVNYTNASDFAR